ncbi:MAG: sugar ABC transporter permease [Anaerolineae bacterium]|nr:sugar ABC transporter permease [Anaerolineae bacterium]
MPSMTDVYSTASTKPRRSLRQIINDNIGFLFILPALILFLVFGLYTVVFAIALSFFRWNGFGSFSILPPACELPECAFVGLKNFQDFLYANPTESQFFWQAFQNNIIIAIAVTVGTILIALPLALALNRALRGQTIYRTLMLLPMVTTGIAVFYVWSFIYEPDGSLNAILQTVGLEALRARQGWLGQPDTALAALIVVMIWGAVPFAMILYLAGLQTIEKDLFDAAAIDGANAWQVVWRIVWPLLRPITVIIVITSFNSSIQGYEQVYLMTNGGPAGHTEVVGLQIFNYGFGDQRQLGMASAMSWTLFVLAFIVAMANLRFFRSQT